MNDLFCDVETTKQSLKDGEKAIQVTPRHSHFKFFAASSLSRRRELNFSLIPAYMRTKQYA